MFWDMSVFVKQSTQDNVNDYLTHLSLWYIHILSLIILHKHFPLSHALHILIQFFIWSYTSILGGLTWKNRLWDHMTHFSSVGQSCPTLCNPMNCSTPGLPVHHQLPEFTQTHIHRVGDAIQPSHPLSSPSPSAPNPSQHQSLFQWVNSLHEVAKVLEFQL